MTTNKLRKLIAEHLGEARLNSIRVTEEILDDILAKANSSEMREGAYKSFTLNDVTILVGSGRSEKDKREILIIRRSHDELYESMA